MLLGSLVYLSPFKGHNVAIWISKKNTNYEAIQASVQTSAHSWIINSVAVGELALLFRILFLACVKWEE